MIGPIIKLKIARVWSCLFFLNDVAAFGDGFSNSIGTTCRPILWHVNIVFDRPPPPKVQSFRVTPLAAQRRGVCVVCTRARAHVYTSRGQRTGRRRRVSPPLPQYTFHFPCPTQRPGGASGHTYYILIYERTRVCARSFEQLFSSPPGPTAPSRRV